MSEGGKAALRDSRRIGWSAMTSGGGASSAQREAEHWFEIPGEFVSQYGVLRLRGHPGTDMSELLQSLREGSYRRPFVLDDGVTRRLHFDFNSVQSEMAIADPLELKFAYTRKMMAFLLFHPEPEHVVIVGLGGGSQTRFCAKRLPQTRVTTVEIDEDVIAMSEFFSVPTWDQRVRLVHADATDYFADTKDDADVVLVDGCDRWGTAPALCESSFYEKLRARLRPNGMLVLNLIGHDNRKAAVLAGIDQAFEGRRILMNVREGSNHLLFAFNDPDYVPDWQTLRRRAEALDAKHGLNFPAFARRLQRSYGVLGWQ
jgi:spermidine synthase